jgi:type II secretory pathway component GspD/PulD (secretin)
MLLAVGTWACTASRSFTRGNNAAMQLDWDLAVTHYAEAVKADPGRADYKMALERAQMASAQSHFEKARAYETRDQLDLALLEYRRVVELQPGGQEARAAIQRLEQTIRDRIEAARPKPAADAMRQQARKQMEEPALNPASREPVVLKFQNRQMKEILDFLGASTGINVAYDKDFLATEGSKAINVNIDGVTLEEALQQILAVNGAYYKVLNPRSIIVVVDSAAKRGVYDEQAVQTFYLSSAEAETIEQLLTKLVTTQTTGLRPTFAANKLGNSITVRGTLPMLQMVERLILMNDKPRAEISVDVEILEVNRGNAKQYGLDLTSYQVGLAFSPESRPDADTASSIFNLNTISAGVSAADFYGSVPSAVVRFLEQDSETKVIAKPNLRGAEGEKLSLRLGEETPVPSTTFYNPYGGGSGGGIATTPLTSFTYKNIGVNLDIEPRVTYDGDIILKVALEISAKGPDQNVAGQNLPSFFSRKVETRLRLRDGESNLLAGLLRESERKTVKGFPGITHVPILRDLFASNDKEIVQTDIVMLLTPHVVRTHALTQKDFTPVHVGTQGNLGLTGPPPLIQPRGEPTPQAAPPAPATGAAGAARQPGQPAAGTPAAVQMPPAAAPGMAAVPPAAAAAQQAPPAQAMAQPPAQQAPAQAGPPAAAQLAPPVQTAPPPAQQAPPTQAAPAPAPPPQADALRIILTPPGAPLMVAAQPATVPISVFGASRISTVTLSLRFDPKVLRVRLVQEGTFLSSGGGSVTFAQQVDAAAGRVDITLTRAGDGTGVSGDGVLASVVFDAVGSGISPLGMGGVVTGPGGLPVPVAFGTASVTVR